MKDFIWGIVGIFVGVLIMFGINLLPEPYSEKDMVMIEDIYIPTLRMAFKDAKLLASEINGKEISLKYDIKGIDKDKILKYENLLKNYGYKSLKNGASEENGEFLEVFSVGEDKLIYAECRVNKNNVSIKYNLEQGNVEIFQEAKYYIYDSRYQYYDMKVNGKDVKIPSLTNVIELKNDEKRNYFADNYINIRYDYEENTTSNQKDAYLTKYGEFLKENGFLQGENKREFYNDIVEISIANDYSFSITAKRKYERLV